MTIRSFESTYPDIHPTAYVDESAVVIGSVIIGKQSSIWPLTVVRGDIQSISVGERTNIQDGSVLHVTHGSQFSTTDGHPLVIGDDVTIGHKAMLHACTIGNLCLIGMGTIILDGAIIENEVMIGAGSLVPPQKVLSSGYLWMGSPVKKARKLSTKELEFLSYSASHYCNLSTRTTT